MEILPPSIDTDIECMLKKSPSQKLKPLYLPVDPENEPKIYKKKDFSRPFFVKTSDGKIEKIKEGKLYFLLQFLPLELWLDIMEIKFVMEKYEFLESIFYDQLEVESCYFENLPEERKLQIIEIEGELVNYSYHGIDNFFKTRYYPCGSIMDRFQCDMNIFNCLELDMVAKLENIGDHMFELVFHTARLMRKWFFVMDRSSDLMISFWERNYNKDLLENSLYRIIWKIREMYALTTTTAPVRDYYSIPANTRLINDKKICNLILTDLWYLINRFNICCTYFDSPPECESCREFRDYFYEFDKWSKGLTPEIAEMAFTEKHDNHYHNPHWLEKDENDEYIIIVLKREGYYN
jgi:hypothetical protein